MEKGAGFGPALFFGWIGCSWVFGAGAGDFLKGKGGGGGFFEGQGRGWGEYFLLVKVKGGLWFLDCAGWCGLCWFMRPVSRCPTAIYLPRRSAHNEGKLYAARLAADDGLMDTVPPAAGLVWVQGQGQGQGMGG